MVLIWDRVDGTWMVLCFGLVVKRAWMTMFCIGHLFCIGLHTPRPFLFVTSPWQQVGWECTKSWEGTTEVMVSNKSWERKEEGGYLEWQHLSSKSLLGLTEPCLPEDGEHLPADGCTGWWLVLSLCFNLNAWVFSLLHFQFSPWSHWGCAGLSCLLGLAHTPCILFPLAAVPFSSCNFYVSVDLALSTHCCCWILP